MSLENEYKGRCSVHFRVNNYYTHIIGLGYTKSYTLNIKEN